MTERLDGLLNAVGKPVLGVSVLFYVTVQTLAEFGMVPRDPVKTEPVYNGHSSPTVMQIRDLHSWHNRRNPDGSFRWDMPHDLPTALSELAETQRSLAEAVREQSLILQEVTMRLDVERRYRPGV